MSDRAKERGASQVGSLGAGNHFVEVDIVDEIFDETTASVFGLRPGCLTVQIHCGSRGLGHQVCTDYVEAFQKAVKKYGIDLPDRELVCAPIGSPEGEAYIGAMRAAANFAFANRQMLAHSARRAFEETFASKTKQWQLSQVYDIAHNMGKIETHEINGRRLKVCVHRKGATRAFGPGAPRVTPGIRADWAAGARAGKHGDSIVGASRHADEHAALLWVDVPRRRARLVPVEGKETDPRG